MAGMLRDFWQDVRISARGLLRTPALALTIVLTVGLGIGATTVMFAAVDAAILRPLPYREAGRLVRIYTDSPPYRFRFSLVDLLALEAQQTHFSSVAAYTDRTMAFSDGVSADRLRGRLVSWRYFDLLAIDPALGRRFTAADETPGTPPAVIISHGLWAGRLGRRADVIGSTVRFDGTDHTVVGVLPHGVGPFEHGQDFFIAARWEPPTRKGPFAYIVLGRLADGADHASAAAELREINRRLFPLWKTSYQDERATWNLMDLQRYTAGDSGTVAALSLAAAAFVWLIACANAANLMVARVTSRRRELTVRAALGASSGRMLRHLLAESALLAAAAAAVGLAFAWIAADVVRSAGADYLPRTNEITLGGRTPIVLAGLTAMGVFMFGLIPTLLANGRVDADALRAARSSTSSPQARRIRDVLVGSQVAITLPLLTLAGLLIVSLDALQRVDVGFDTRSVLTGSIQLPTAQYRESARVEATWTEIRRQLEGVPGVAAVAFADGRPPNDVGNFNNFELESSPTPPGGSQPVTPWVAVTPEYFGVLGLELVEGRLLDERDRQDPGANVVVDLAWARRFFPAGSAVGRRLRGGGCSTCPWTTVVGVVSEVKYAGLQDAGQGTVYTPLTGSSFRNVVLRSRTDAAALIPFVRQAVRAVDPAVPLSSVLTADELVAASLSRPRSLSTLVAALAIVALALSAIGIYGLMSYFVQQHAREMGIRLALGGSPAAILRLVLGRGMRLVGLGVVAGLAAASAASEAISSLLFTVRAGDAMTFTTATMLLVTVALAACWVPGRRAMRLDPTTVLRDE